MRKSRSETAETRERIVSTASAMFLEKGIAAVGMREIMGAAELTQGGFYRHFDSKEQLIAEAIRAAFDQLIAMFEEKTAGAAPAKALETIVSIYLGQSQRAGNRYLCPLAMLGAELAHCDAEVRAAAIEGFGRLVKLVAAHLTDRSPAEAETQASNLVITMIGAVILAKITPDRTATSVILRHARQMIDAQLQTAPKRVRAKRRSSAKK